MLTLERKTEPPVTKKKKKNEEEEEAISEEEQEEEKKTSLFKRPLQQLKRKRERERERRERERERERVDPLPPPPTAVSVFSCSFPTKTAFPMITHYFLSLCFAKRRFQPYRSFFSSFRFSTLSSLRIHLPLPSYYPVVNVQCGNNSIITQDTKSPS